MVKLPSKRLERDALTADFTCVVGVDEVGMGCLAGPVVVCAALFLPSFFTQRVRELEGLRDSKLLQAAQRERYAAALARQPHLRHTIAVIDAPEVDALNVYQASLVGMRRALDALGLTVNDNPLVLIDGRGHLNNLPWQQRAIIGGDRRVFAIAAASVLAKTHRDALMVAYAADYPGYGFERHKGYGTSMHRERIAALGPSPLHRRSFRL